MFSSQSKARVVHLCTKLNQTRKEHKTGVMFFGQIKALANEMAAAGKPMDDDDIISYVLAGLYDEYDGFVPAITALIKAEQVVTLSDVYSQFMSYEGRLEGRVSGSGSSVNAANRGGRGGFIGRGRGNYPNQQRNEHELRGGAYDQRGNNDHHGYGLYWLTTIEDAKDIVRTCNACQRFAAKPHSPAAELMPIPLAWPFAQWGLGMVGKLHKSWPGGHVYLLVAIDKFTKWIEAVLVTSADATSVVSFMKGIVFLVWRPQQYSYGQRHQFHLPRIQGLLRRGRNQTTLRIGSAPAN
jgi:hypothetical protein